jgi:hypothetical protein
LVVRITHKAIAAKKIRKFARRSFRVAFLSVIPCLSLGQATPSPNCKMIASPPPLATFGGPAIATKGYTELGLAVGGYGELLPSPCGHGGGTDWLARWRRGLGDRIDLGFDVLADNRSDGTFGATAKVAVRYFIQPGLRLEAGLGAADEGDGRSVNADVAATIGTTSLDRTWNYYSSFRLAGSHGCTGLFCTGSLAGTNAAPPGAILPLGAIGSSAHISQSASFIMEGGLGGIFSREHPGTGVYVHLSFGVLFDVGERR